MRTIDLKGSLRTGLGKKISKHIRNEELVPCVIYGNKTETIHFTVSERELKPLLYTPHAFLVNIDLDGTMYRGVLGEIQFHPTSDIAIHIDFLRISDDKPVTIDIPVEMKGNSIGVKSGGKLQVLARKIKTVGLIKDLPDSLPVDVTHLDLGKTIFVKDLKYPNLTLLSPSSATVCRVKATRATREAATAAAAAAAPKGKKK